MGKTDNLTIRIEPDLKEKAELLRNKYYKRVPMNVFLEIMLEYGMDLQEKIGEYERDLYIKAKEERLADYIEQRNIDETNSIIGDEARQKELEKKRKKSGIYDT